MNFIHRLRQKPQRVRERIVLFTVIILSPILFIIWSITAHYGDEHVGTSTIDTIRNAVTGSFGNPLYKETFGEPGATKPTPNENTSSPSQ